MGFVLVQLNGTEPGHRTLVRGEVTIGREMTRELPIDDELSSRLHARIWLEDDDWSIEDCASRNGTYVNEKLISRVFLRDGDLIRIGERLIVFLKDREGTGLVGLSPSRLAASTLAVRVSGPGRQEVLSAELRAESPIRAVREAAVLSKFALECHRVDSISGVHSGLVAASAEGLQCSAVLVFRMNATGRMICQPESIGDVDLGQELAWTARLAVERDEASLLKPNDESSGTSRAVMVVPLSSRGETLSAVVCVGLVPGPDTNVRFEQEDLHFLMAIGYQAGIALENVEHRARLESANDHLREALRNQDKMIGESAVIRTLLEDVGQVARTDSTALVFGESGTGKELVAHMIHDWSARSAGPFIAVNCAAFNEALLESELFGHEKGAYTGAEKRRLGQFERANHGTIFLDEIGELSLACQAKLLRVIEGYSFTRVGGTESVDVDVRIIAATHRDLAGMADENTFRSDLFFRLRVIELTIPPLRERREDIDLLAGHYLEHFARQTGGVDRYFSDDALSRLRSHSWPGNVRELRNVVERAVVMGRSSRIDTADLQLTAVSEIATREFGLISLAEAELIHINNVLEAVGGNKTQACKILEIGRGTLYKRLEGSGDLT